MQGNTTLKPIEIKRYIVGNEKINAVNARDLWRNLDSKQEFSRWVQNRLKATMAEENIDYILVLETYKSQKISESAENSLISEVVEFAEIVVNLRQHPWRFRVGEQAFIFRALLFDRFCPQRDEHGGGEGAGFGGDFSVHRGSLQVVERGSHYTRGTVVARWGFARLVVDCLRICR